jgi:sugar O-acyltransferase (sialic acid O-acetyltransferase NeuD family)
VSSLLILGAGGHGKVVADAAEFSEQWGNIAFLDDKFERDTKHAQWDIIGRMQDLALYAGEYDGIVIAIGDASARMKWMSQVHALGFSLATIIHPRAVISTNVNLGEGSVVMANAVINYGVKIGAACIINTAATVDHECQLAAGVHICPGTHLAGNVSVGECSWVGIGASVIQGITIGRHVMVGAGATVINNINDDLTVIGTPAKPIEM